MRKILQPLIALLGLLALAAPSGASGALATLGRVAPSPQPRCNANGTLLFWQESSALAPGYVAPGPGAITSWSTNASAGEGQLYAFKVLRPLRATRFRVVGHDGPRTLTPGQLNVFQTAIPVETGDLLALSSENSAAVHTACVFSTGAAEDNIAGSTLAAADGETIGIQSKLPSGELVNLSATFLPAPTITTLNPESGPPGGGSLVAIAGSDLSQVSDVSFGAVPAKSFTVSSESRISAVAPPGQANTQVPVTVTTVAGSATATFSYGDAPSAGPRKRCLVPKLRTKRLSAARRKLRKAGCRLGKVTKVRRRGAKPGSVLRQSPKPGKVLRSGAKVRVTISGAG